MKNFQYYLPVNLVFGRGCVEKTGEIASKNGKKALIVTGRSSTKKSGLLARVTESLHSEDIETVLFDQVMQNPLTTTAIEAAGFARQENCDMVIGIGGGSIMDCAKAAAFLAVNDGDINDYIFNRKTSDQALPIILIPTTCGTGSEGNGFAVLTNPDNGDKKSLRCNAIIAKASLIDPECMMTMPKTVLANVGFDAFCHCMEAYLSSKGQPMTDMMSVQGMELIGKYLVLLYKDVLDDNEKAEAWDAISWASTLGGMVINTAGVTLPHGMEHPASGLKNIVHGLGLAALTPVITAETISRGNQAVLEKYAVISRCLGGKDAYDCVKMQNQMLDALDMKVTLGDMGVKKTDVEWMTQNCLKVSAAGISYHPVVFSENEIRELYIKAL